VKSFPLQAGFRSIQEPFKMGCNVFRKVSRLRSSHYVNSWSSCSLPQIFPSPLSTSPSITHVPQYPAPIMHHTFDHSTMYHNLCVLGTVEGNTKHRRYEFSTATLFWGIRRRLDCLTLTMKAAHMPVDTTLISRRTDSPTQKDAVLNSTKNSENLIYSVSSSWMWLWFVIDFHIF
jgi:hypothetical protein